MLAFLTGILVTKTRLSPKGPLLVLDVNGIGYELLTHPRAVDQAPEKGATITVHTSLIVREDAMTLVGFLFKEERDLFDILQRASGVGVKVALALITELSVLEIVQAVISGEHKTLVAAKGVGPKLAQKIVLELKEKMVSWRETSQSLSSLDWDENLAPLPQSTAFVEAETVLLSLGYTVKEVLQSLQSLQIADANTVSSEDVLKQALKWLAVSA